MRSPINIYIPEIDLWSRAVLEFLDTLRSALRERLRGFIALDEGEEIYESNVVVILSRIDMETLEEISRIKFEIEDRYRGKVSIKPYIALEGEDIIRRIQMFCE